jgi:hypothetical protein
VIFMAGNEQSMKQNQYPFALYTPRPKHFELYGKAVGIKLTGRLPGDCDDPQYQLLCEYGMPNDRMAIVATLPGSSYGSEFEEFTVELFGVEGSEPLGGKVLKHKKIGSIEAGSYNLRPMTPPEKSLGGGYVLVEVPEKRVELQLWRCRIFLEKSSLCLEMLWHGDVKGWMEHVISRPFEPAVQYSRMAKAAKLRDTIMLETRRGGNKNPQEIKELWTEENYRRFVLLVKELIPKWAWIKSNGYDPAFFFTPQEWITSLRDRLEFSGLFGGYTRLTDDLLQRVTDSNLSMADREPTSLACVHAARELSITDIYKKYGKREPAASTLRTYYKKGKKLLRKNLGEQN